MGVWAIVSAIALLADAAAPVQAQTAAPSPVTSCALPNVAAATLNAVSPTTPRAAAERGISGAVSVRITLDDQSHLTSATISKSPSAILNRAALEAARASTFRTAIRDCEPVGGSFLFIVIFARTPAELARYFLGRWSCIEQDGQRSSIFYAMESGYLQELHGGQRTTFRQAGDDLWLTFYDPEMRYTASTRATTGSDRFLFTGAYSTVVPVEKPVHVAVTYTQSDATHFVRTLARGSDPDALSVQASQRCTRDS